MSYIFLRYTTTLLESTISIAVTMHDRRKRPLQRWRGTPYHYASTAIELFSLFSPPSIVRCCILSRISDSSTVPPDLALTLEGAPLRLKQRASPKHTLAWRAPAYGVHAGHAVAHIISSEPKMFVLAKRVFVGCRYYGV